MNSLKEKGNEFFMKQDYSSAIQCYTQAIRLTNEKLDKKLIEQTNEELIYLISEIKTNECLLNCFNNRSQCFLNLGRLSEALDDVFFKLKSCHRRQQ